MIVCCQCGEKGFDPRGRCGKCGARTIQRRSSFNTPLEGDRDRWANRYLFPDPSNTSPHLRRQTVPIPHLSRSTSRKPSGLTLSKPIKPAPSPFEVLIDEVNSPTTLHHPLPPLPSVLRAKSRNILRPTLSHANTAPELPIVPTKVCDHNCGCGKLGEDLHPRKPDPHAPIKKRLFGDLQRVCQRPGQSAAGIEHAGGATHFGTRRVPPPLPLPLPTKDDVTSGAFHPISPVIISQAGLFEGYPKAGPNLSSRYPPFASRVPTPAAAGRNADHLPLTSVPQPIPVPTPANANRPPPSMSVFDPLRGVRMDIVPNCTPATEISVGERRSSYLREISRQVESVTAPSARVARVGGTSVADIKTRYEASKTGLGRVAEEANAKKTTAGQPPRPWPPIPAGQPPVALPTNFGPRSPKPKANTVAEVRKRYDGITPARPSTSASPETQLKSILQTAGTRTYVPTSHVRVWSVESSRRTSLPIVSRRASISSIETVIVRNLSPVLPPRVPSDVARLRAMFESTLPEQGPRPGRKFAPTPRATSLDSITSRVTHNSTSTVATGPEHQRYASNVSRTGTLRWGGNFFPCPCCGDKIAYFDRDRVAGPYGATWHQSCLRCGGGEGKGKKGVDKRGCGKALDSRAGVDLEGIVWCKGCSLNRRPTITPAPSASPALPPQRPQGRIISLKHPQPMRLQSPEVLIRDYVPRWPSPISVSGRRYGLLRRTSSSSSSSRRRRTSGRIKEGII